MVNKLHFRQILIKLQLFAADKRGVTGFEYALIGGFVSLGILTAVTFFGESFNHMLESFHLPVGGTELSADS
jgi:Flp pilus assembly pilin Flp